MCLGADDAISSWPLTRHSFFFFPLYVSYACHTIPYHAIPYHTITPLMRTWWEGGRRRRRPFCARIDDQLSLTRPFFFFFFFSFFFLFIPPLGWRGTAGRRNIQPVHVGPVYLGIDIGPFAGAGAEAGDADDPSLGAAVPGRRRRRKGNVRAEVEMSRWRDVHPTTTRRSCSPRHPLALSLSVLYALDDYIHTSRIVQTADSMQIAWRACNEPTPRSSLLFANSHIYLL